MPTLSPPAATENHLRSTKAALDALAAKIEALQWTPTGGSAGPAFSRVELFDDLDLVAAFKKLIITESRICLLIHSGDAFEAQRADRQLVIHHKSEIFIVFTDRVMKKRTEALLGSDTNPGLLVLRNLVLPAVTGLATAQPSGVFCTPARGSLLQVEANEQQFPGRLAYLLELELQGGWLKADYGKSPVW